MVRTVRARLAAHDHFYTTDGRHGVLIAHDNPQPHGTYAGAEEVALLKIEIVC
jgi:hypothetical protein